MRPVHTFYNFPVNSPGNYSKLGPEFKSWLRNPPHMKERAFLLPKLKKESVCKLGSYFLKALSLSRDPEFSS